MNYLYSLTILLAAIMIIQSCSTTKLLNSNKKFTFPDDWYGSYTGTMNWYVGSEKKAEIPIKIEILESNDSNTIIWRMTYDSTKLFPVKNIKDYKIVKYIEDIHLNNNHNLVHNFYNYKYHFGDIH